MKRIPGVEYDVNKRWESGTAHNPLSEALMKRVKDLDWEVLGGYFDFKTGGDGDNGETLMYLLDIYFDEMQRTSS